MKHCIFTAVVVLLVSACSGATNVPPVSFDGLRLQPNSSLGGTVYLREGVDLKVYNTFAVDPCTVAFRQNWQRDQNSSSRALTDDVSEADMNKIRTTLATLCDEQFRSVLSDEPAYSVVSGDAIDRTTLLLKPSIIDLDIAAPDIQSSARSQSYTTEAGEMTLFLEIVDASSGEILYRIIDRRREHNTGQLQWTNSVTNLSDARRTMRYWGKSLRRALDHVAAQKQHSN